MAIPVPPPATGSLPDVENFDSIAQQAIDGVPNILGQDPYKGNEKRYKQLLTELKKEALDQRWVFERVWWRAILYLLGRQWIYYDKKRGQWIDKRMAKWVPRPVTNKIAEAHESILAMFSSVNLGTTALPVGHDSGNVATAEVADKLQPFLHDGHQMDAVMRMHDWWLTLTGNAFLHTYWATTQDRNVIVPNEQCMQCGKVFTPSELSGMSECPACGAMSFATAADPQTGMPVGQPVVTGKGCTVALSPFEIAVPPSYTDFASVPYVIQMRWRTKRYYEDLLGKEEAKQMVFERMPSERSLQLLKSVSTQSDVAAMPLTWGSGHMEQDGTPEYDLWLKPNREFPQGLFVRVAGDGDAGIVITDGDAAPGPLPYRTKKGEIIFPFVHTRFKPFGGRMWGSAPIDLIIQKNDQVNQLDSLVQMIVQRVANPIWLEPKGTEVKSFTGEPGLVVKYTPLSIAGVAKPERLPGENVPASLFQLRQQYLTDIEVLSGTYDVIKGAKPTGVEAFSALQLLVERSQSRFSTVLTERGESYRQWYSTALELERQYGPDERTYAVTKPNSGYTFRHFLNADLQGAVEIRVEDGSQAPKTNLGKRAAIEQANQLKLINPQDPEQAYAILSHFGLQDLVPSLDNDVKSALAEQDTFEGWIGTPDFNPQMLEQAFMAFQQQQQQFAAVQQQYADVALQATMVGLPAPAAPQPPQMPDLTPFQFRPYHRHEVHYGEHRKWANSDAARQMFQQFPVLEQLFILHLAQHEQAMMEKAQQAAMMAAPARPQPQAGGGGRAMQNSNQESGAIDTVPKGQGQRADNRGPE